MFLPQNSGIEFLKHVYLHKPMVTKILNYKFTQAFLTTLIILGATICIFTPNYFLFKMGSQFAVQIMIGYLLLAMMFLFFRQSQLMFTSFACCAGLCLFLKYSSNPILSAPTANSTERISVAHFNLSASNEDYTKTIQRIIETDADIISLQEVNPDWNFVLQESLSELYPHSNSIVRFDPYGIAVYSKFEFQQLDTFFYEDIPNLTGTIKAEGNGKEFQFIASHTTPPLYQSAYDRMKQHLLEISKYANKIESPIITFGDYNAPPWWAEIQQLKEAANLKDSRRSASYGFADIFQNPVDYIFYSDHLTCLKFEPIKDEDATHLGIKGVYQFNSIDIDVAQKDQ